MEIVFTSTTEFLCQCLTHPAHIQNALGALLSGLRGGQLLGQTVCVCFWGQVIWKSWMVSLHLEEETTLPRAARAPPAGFLLNKQQHSKYWALAGVAVSKCPRHPWLSLPPSLKKAFCCWP